jgi:hypothetical protein
MHLNQGKDLVNLYGGKDGKENQRRPHDSSQEESKSNTQRERICSEASSWKTYHEDIGGKENAIQILSASIS